MPVEDFLAQLTLGLGKVAFEHKDFAEAERQFHSAFEEHPEAGAAAEARYWEGVSRYKATHSSDALKEAAVVLKRQYPDSEWTRKSSVWGG